MTIIVRNNAVRPPIVPGSLTAGGLAGYFKPGTRTSETNAATASNAAVARGGREPMRPCAKAKTRANKSLSDGNTTRRTSSASSNSLAWLSSSTDFGREDLAAALADFRRSERRFGGLGRARRRAEALAPDSRPAASGAPVAVRIDRGNSRRYLRRDGRQPANDSRAGCDAQAVGGSRLRARRI